MKLKFINEDEQIASLINSQEEAFSADTVVNFINQIFGKKEDVKDTETLENEDEYATLDEQENQVSEKLEEDSFETIKNRKSKADSVADYKKVADEIKTVEDEVKARKQISRQENIYNTFEEVARHYFKEEGIYNPTKRQMDARIADLKKSNPDIEDGKLKGKKIYIRVSEEVYNRILEKSKQRKEYKAQFQTRKNAELLADEFYKIADDNFGFASMKKMQALLDNNINENNIVAFLDAYDRAKTKQDDSSIIDTVTSEINAGGTQSQRKVLMTILEKLCQAAKKAGVSDGDIEKARKDFETSLNKEFAAIMRRTNPKEMEKAIDFLRGAIAAKRTANVDEISDSKAIDSFNQNFNAANAEAQFAYNEAKGEGWSWTARAGDTVCGWFGCNTIEEMEQKLGKNAASVKRLASAKSEQEFKQIYKEIFGIEFDKNKVAAREAALGNYQQANALSSVINISNEILSKADKLSYSDLCNEIMNKMEIDSDSLNMIIEKYSLMLDKSITSDGDRQDMLMEFLRETNSNSCEAYRTLTRGKTLAQMQKDVDLLTRSAFGTSDIAKDVAQFSENMVITEMVTEGVFEVAGTIALQFVPGLGQMAAARLAVSAAKWGTRAVKIANAAAKAEKAFAAVNKVQNGTKFVSKTGKIASKIGSQMVATGAATVAVDVSNGDDVKSVMRKTLMNMSFAGVGSGSNMLAPKLMQLFKINSALANEIAEEIINAAGSFGVTKVAGDDYGKTDAFIDFATGMVLSRLGHIKTSKSNSGVPARTSEAGMSGKGKAGGNGYNAPPSGGGTLPPGKIGNSGIKELKKLKNDDGSIRYSSVDIDKLSKNIPSHLKDKIDLSYLMSLKGMTVDDALQLLAKIDTPDKIKLLDLLIKEAKSDNSQVFNYHEIDDFFDNISDSKLTDAYNFFKNSIDDYKHFGEGVISKESFLNCLSYYVKTDEQANIYKNMILRIKNGDSYMHPNEVFKYVDLKSEGYESLNFDVTNEKKKMHENIKNKRQLTLEQECQLAFIDDEYILKYLENNIGTMKNEDLNAILALVTEADGTIYSDKCAFFSINTRLEDVLEYFEKNGIDINSLGTNSSPSSIRAFQNAALPIDMVLATRFGHMREYLAKGVDVKMKNYLYDNMYLKTLKEFGFGQEIVARLDKINKTFDVKIMLSSNLKEIDSVLDYIEAELNEWKNASKGKAKFPPVIDFNAADKSWYDVTTAYGQSASGAYSSPSYGRMLAFNGQNKSSVEHAIRHEMTHSNDLKQGSNIPSKYDLNKIMPKKQKLDANGNVCLDSKGMIIMVPDYDNCMFKEEFRNAGIPEWHISYAYNNTKEFIAVAAEGDMSKYSPAFKQMLIDFGMPDWMFQMKPKKAI